MARTQLPQLAQFTGAPFHLDDPALAWVEQIWLSLSLDEKIGQVCCERCADPADTGELDTYLARKIGAVSRSPACPPDVLASSVRYLQERSGVPLLQVGNLEFEEAGAVGVPGGTQFPNQLTVAATGDSIWASRMGTIAALEGRALGFNWSFSPVVDLAFNPRNPVVSTRSFGSDLDLVRRCSVEYITAMQARGMAACAKHWPGDGVDDRDQHLVTSVNRLEMDNWRATYGQIYRDVIDAGTKTIMAGHIALPAYFSDEERRSGVAWRPATLSYELSTTLLREELGFRGLLVSDATPMAGFGAHGRREDLIPQCLNAGCDMLLFTTEEDALRLRRAVERGIVSEQRLDEAVLRGLALKASLGLHLIQDGRDQAPPPFDRSEHQRWADACASRAVTLIKDKPGLLPISPATSRRLAIIMEQDRANPLRPLPDLVVPDLLRSEGFDVTVYPAGSEVRVEDHDVLLYVVADEAKQSRTLRVNWTYLQGPFPKNMVRYWHDLPTIFISLGHPYHLYDTPQCPVFINAYSPTLPVQRAVVDALVGRAAFAGVSPVDPYAGLGEGEA